MKYDTVMMWICLGVVIISALGFFIGYEHYANGGAINMVLTLQAFTLMRVIMMGDKE